MKEKFYQVPDFKFDPENHSEKVTLSEEWAELSTFLCKSEFINSLVNFFKAQNIKNILECACGDGYVLSGVVGDGITGVGIDNDDYLIKRAERKNSSSDIEYKKMSVLDLDANPTMSRKNFDAVMCRGNSITAFGCWGSTPETFNVEESWEAMIEGLQQMWRRIKDGGLLYLDVTKQEDIDAGNQTLAVNSGAINLKGTIVIDKDHKRRDVFGNGTINGKLFNGGSSSYLISPNELRELVIKFLKPKEIWTPKEIKDDIYEVICARK